MSHVKVSIEAIGVFVAAILGVGMLIGAVVVVVAVKQWKKPPRASVAVNGLDSDDFTSADYSHSYYYDSLG